MRDVLPEVLLRGAPAEMQWRPSPRLVLELGDVRAVLRLDRDGTRENWLLTAFYRRDGGGGGGTGELPSTPAYTPPRRDIGAAAGAPPRSEVIASAARRFNAYTPTGRAVLLEPKVVELDRIIVSHDAEGRPNPAYPHKEGVQPPGPAQQRTDVVVVERTCRADHRHSVEARPERRPAPRAPDQQEGRVLAPRRFRLGKREIEGQQSIARDNPSKQSEITFGNSGKWHHRRGLPCGAAPVLNETAH